MSRYKKHFLLVAIYSLLPLFILFTYPEELPVPLMVIPFILLFISIFITLVLALRNFERYDYLSRRRIYILSSIGAGFPVLLVVFQTLHQLSFKDVFIAVAIVLGVGLYVSKLDLGR